MHVQAKNPCVTSNFISGVPISPPKKNSGWKEGVKHPQYASGIIAEKKKFIIVDVYILILISGISYIEVWVCLVRVKSNQFDMIQNHLMPQNHGFSQAIDWFQTNAYLAFPFTKLRS